MDISSLLTAIPGAISQGILWGVMALGVYTTYRILNISDLTVDGSFATGGCVAAVCLVNGLNPFEDRKKYVSKIGVVFGQRSQLAWDIPAEDTFDLLKDI